MICLLCPSPAVADCLCVECGAKLWAAYQRVLDPHYAGWFDSGPGGESPERLNALRLVPTRETASAFLAEYERVKEAWAKVPPCSRGCTNHEES